MKKLIVLFTVLVMLLGISACGSKEEAAVDEPEVTVEDSKAEPEVDGTAYGYGGSDPVEAAVYKFMAEEVSQNYSEAEIHIPTVNIIHIDFTPEDEILVYGDFWIENYNIDGDTLKSVSGGHHPGVIHMNKNYDVTIFDQVEDGDGFEASAKKLFGEEFDNFMKIYSDSDARNELRKTTVSEYVKLNGLKVTQYQDEGWDPVELYH